MAVVGVQPLLQERTQVASSAQVRLQLPELGALEASAAVTETEWVGRVPCLGLPTLNEACFLGLPGPCTGQIALRL